MTTQVNSWYKTGTVTVTNGLTSVVGSGTSFESQVHPGDVFTIDKSRIYEVESVTDDTHLVLTENYQGSTQSGINYYVLRFWNSGWSMNASLAQQVATLVEDFQNALDNDFKGDQGDSFVWKGPWIELSTYNTLETVSRGGCSWVSVQDDNAGNDPLTDDGTWWNCMVSDSLAEAARDKAEEWAEAAVGTEVESGQYSAKHWSTKAAENVETIGGIPI